MTDATKQLFAQAAELPLDQRADFVAAACGDDFEQRSRLLALLRAHDEVGDFLEHPTGLVEAAALDIAADGDDLEPGQAIGNYVLLHRLGRGGFGTVWRARQHQPIVRDVALKILHGGLDTGRVMQRFLAERQTLARMDHPSIAKIFDAGTTATGRPWLAMELVDGDPITRCCELRGLDLRQRLEVFAATCEAVQHAHHKGVVHRDLKPSNILVVDRDCALRPMVIDFGVARVLDDDGPMVTATGEPQLLGTPDYMSPEQASFDRDAVDTRTDVYSLGVVLYELTAGVRPFDHPSGPAGQHELLRRIREEDPRPPSRRAAAARLPREIDWITARAMAKAPHARYQTAAALADDVRRLLADEPVAAGPPSAFYGLCKLIRRRRWSVLAAAGVVLSLGLGLLVAARGWANAEQQSRTATRALDLLDAIWAAADPTRFGRSDYPVRELFADFERELPRRTVGEPGVELRLRMTVGRLQHIFGMLPEALQHSSRAVQLAREHGSAPELVRTLAEHGRVLLDRDEVAAAEASARGALAAAEALDPPAAHLVTAALELCANCALRRGDRTEAASLAERALALREQSGSAEDVVRSLLQLARLHAGTGSTDLAMYYLQQALRHLEQSDPNHPDAPVALQHLAFVQQKKGDLAAAEAAYRDSLTRRRALYGADHPHVAWAEADLAWLLHDRGRDAEALPLLRHALAALRTRLGEQHLYVSEATQRLGAVLAALGEVGEAKLLLLQAAERYRLLPQHPTEGLVGCLGNLAALQWQLGEREAARATQQDALDLARRDLPSDHFVLSVSMTNLAWMAVELGDRETAVALLREALAASAAAGRDGEARLQRQRLVELLVQLGREAEAAAVRAGRE